MHKAAAAASAVLLVGYAVASNALMAHAPSHPATVALLFGPLVAAFAIAGWRRRHTPTLVACALLAGVLALVVARGGVADAQRLYLLQHAALHAALAAAFAFTLRRGAVPLITAAAERVHRPLTPAMAAYTRRLTAAWVGYFIVMIVVSFVVYAFTSWSTWSLFCTAFTPLAAVAFFAGEHVLRYRRHPEFERASLVQSWRAYRHASADGTRTKEAG